MSQPSSAPVAPSTPTTGQVSGTWAQCLALSVGVVTAVGFEVVRLREAAPQSQGWLTDVNIDTTPFLILFALVPICWWPFHLGQSRAVRQPTRAGGRPVSDTRIAWLQCLTIGIISLWVSHSIAQMTVGTSGRPFGSLPPAYHDEYSYMFQAQTFADGRLAYPSHPSHP
ncbi:MAG: hypothetical protein ABGZ17_22320, partial [Planctomycetaceae bacterium]